MAITEDEEFELLSLERERAMKGSVVQKSVQQPIQSKPSIDQKISSRPSVIKDLVQNPPTMQHPLGAALRTLGGAAELYQGMPASVGLDLQAGKPQDILSNLLKVATGDRPAQYGDIYRGTGVPEPLAAAGGLYADTVLAPGGAQLLKSGGTMIKNIPSKIKPLLKFTRDADQADMAKGALDALKKSYGSAYEVALKPVENVPTNVNFGKMPVKVLNEIKNKKDVYNVRFNQNGSIDNSIGNVKQIKRAADQMVTPAMRMESTKDEISQIKNFAGEISREMRIAARKVGKPIDVAMDAYGEFRKHYDVINSRLMENADIASANQLKAMVKLTTDDTIKKSMEILSKTSPELKSVVNSMKNRDLVRNLLKFGIAEEALNPRGLTRRLIH